MKKKNLEQAPFNCQQQLHKDLWNAVYKIVPVLDLIRRKGISVCDGSDSEVNQYILYTDTFTNFTYDDYKYLMSNCNSKMDYRISEAIALLSINHGIKDEEREKIRVALDERYHGYNMFMNKDEDIRKNYMHYIATHFH